MLGRIMDPPRVGSLGGSGTRDAPGGECSKAVVPLLFACGETRAPAIGKKKPRRSGAFRSRPRRGVTGGTSFPLFQTCPEDRKSTRLNSSHLVISYAVFCLKKKKKNNNTTYDEVHTP